MFNIVLKNRFQFVLVALLLTTAIFFRFWQIRDYVVFLGDEGRDMLVMRRIFTEKKLPFLGPTASVGGFYLGPIYYWMAAPFLLISRFDPVGPAYFVAILGVATVFLLYKFLKETVGFYPAILASFLYASAPLIVRYSRSSWNPNPLPFFALLMIYFIYQGINKNKLIFFVFAGAAFGISIQLHYLAGILLVIATAIIVLFTNWRKWLLAFTSFAIGAIITFSPFLIFEIRHQFPNFNTILEFTTRGSTLGFKTIHLVWLISNIGNILLEEISQLKLTILTKISFWILTIGAIFGLIRNWHNPSQKLIFAIGLIWFIGGLAGLRFYTGQIFDYYFGIIFPAPFLLAGLVFSLTPKNILFKIITTLLVVIIFIYFVANGIWRSSPNKLLDQTASVADFVIERAEGKPFNFGLISDQNSDHAYRYYLEIKGYKPLELETLVTEQLMVVCESKKCAPLGHPIWEIAGFGRAEIKGEWELPNIGIKIFHLTHWPGAPSPAGKPAVKGG